MKIVMTGGHFSPALSVIEQLGKDHEVVIIGRKTAMEGDSTPSLEYTIAEKRGIPFKELKAARLQRKMTVHGISSLLRFPRSVYNARRLLKKIKPDAIMSFGGYIGLTVSIASVGLSIPVVIHEQTQGAGLANKISAWFARSICISFLSSSVYFPKDKTILTGNPVREDIFKMEHKQDVPSNLPIIYVTGGSTGSHIINKKVGEIIDLLANDFVVIHQTGDSALTNDYEELERKKKTLTDAKQKRYLLKKYVLPNEIGWILNRADLVIGRAGINTVTELCALGKPALLIPLPHGQKNEQLQNAQLLEKIGIGTYIDQDNLTPEFFHGKIVDMIKNKKEYLAHKEQAQEYYIENAAEKIVSVLLQLAPQTLHTI